MRIEAPWFLQWGVESKLSISCEPRPSKFQSARDNFHMTIPESIIYNVLVSLPPAWTTFGLSNFCLAVPLSPPRRERLLVNFWVSQAQDSSFLFFIHAVTLYIHIHIITCLISTWPQNSIIPLCYCQANAPHDGKRIQIYLEVATWLFSFRYRVLSGVSISLLCPWHHHDS